MERPGLPRSKLTLWALAVLAQTATDAGCEPVRPTPRLRLAMAWLAVSAGEGGPLELWWQEARKLDPGGADNPQNGYIRRTGLQLRLEGICQRVGARYWEVRHYAAKLEAEWP